MHHALVAGTEVDGADDGPFGVHEADAGLLEGGVRCEVGIAIEVCGKGVCVDEAEGHVVVIKGLGGKGRGGVDGCFTLIVVGCDDSVDGREVVWLDGVFGGGGGDSHVENEFRN